MLTSVLFITVCFLVHANDNFKGVAALCGNILAMLTFSRYVACFQMVADKSRYFGLFGCIPEPHAAGGSRC